MKIFCAGAVTDWDDPLGWHEDAREQYPDEEIVNAYDYGEDVPIYEEPERAIEPALEAVTDCDGLIAHWDDGVSLPAAVGYMWNAKMHDIPVVVWYSGERDTDNVSPAVLYLSEKRVYSSLDKAMDVLCMMGPSTSFDL